jgi:enhancing lycopene biosynthesis protein 2
MKTQKKFAVILAGCGNRDGAEIHESVMTLYAIAELSPPIRYLPPT